MTTPSSDPFAMERERMVRLQLEARGLREPRVLDAMRRVPRHEFVRPEDQHRAYDDRPLVIGAGQTISQPYIVAAMTAALRPQPGDRVLEVGTGSGYQAAVLSLLAGEVLTVERLPALADRARATLARLGYTNVRVLTGDGSGGWPAEQPYDGILVTAAAPRVPDVLVEQLAEGGRLVIPVGSRDFQELVVVERVGGRFREQRREGCIFVPLVGRFGWEVEDR
jgi:protein-L-isoaspartate(D-aspartate) O-methyltransferase